MATLEFEVRLTRSEIAAGARPASTEAPFSSPSFEEEGIQVEAITLKPLRAASAAVRVGLTFLPIWLYRGVSIDCVGSALRLTGVFQVTGSDTFPQDSVNVSTSLEKTLFFNEPFF